MTRASPAPASMAASASRSTIPCAVERNDAHPVGGKAMAFEHAGVLARAHEQPIERALAWPHERGRQHEVGGLGAPGRERDAARRNPGERGDARARRLDQRAGAAPLGVDGRGIAERVEGRRPARRAPPAEAATWRSSRDRRAQRVMLIPFPSAPFAEPWPHSPAMRGLLKILASGAVPRGRSRRLLERFRAAQRRGGRIVRLSQFRIILTDYFDGLRRPSQGKRPFRGACRRPLTGSCTR